MPAKPALIKRRWVAVDLLQGPGAPYEGQNAAELSAEDIAALLEAIDLLEPWYGRGTADLAALRLKLKGEG